MQVNESKKQQATTPPPNTSEDDDGATTISGAPCVCANEERLAHEVKVHQVELETQNAELREARDHLEASLREFIEFFDSAPVAYVVLNPEGYVTQVNRAGAMMLGVQSGQIVGMKFKQLVPAYHLHNFSIFWREAWRDAASKQDPVCCEVPMASGRTKSARIIDVRMTATRFTRDGVGTLLVALEDITARKIYEAEIRRSEQALLSADRNKNHFLAALSHELRNPLSPIRSSLEILQHDQRDEGMHIRALAVIDRQVEHMSRMVDELLDVSRISQAKVQLRLDRIDLTKVVSQTVEDHRVLCQRGDIELCVQSELGLWVEGDSARMVQIISNLINNSAKFTPPGGRITVTLFAQDGNAILRIEDTGVGVEAEVIDQVFEPFIQGEQKLDRAHGGLGLGLAMVKGLVELQKGTVKLDSAGRNRGTCVEVSLPLTTAPDRKPQAVQEATEHACRLVIIDDNMDAADSLCDLLRSRGHEVSCSYDGRSGLELVRRVRPDVVICDIGLPVVDGYAVAQALRADAQFKELHIIALTGYAHSRDIERSKDAGFDAHLVKPCNPKELVRALQKF